MTQPVRRGDIDRLLKRPRGWVRVLIIIFSVTVFMITAMIGGGLAYLYAQLPSLRQLEENKPSIITTVYSDSNEVIGEFYIERRMLVPQSQIPDFIRQGIISIEDKLFYQHWGINPTAIMRAFIVNIKAGRVVQGGSTITQQLAKVLFLTPEQKVVRKIKEALLSLQIEHRYTKSEILTLYLNQIYFGEGAYGIEAAARTYFGKRASELRIAEAALLCGLPKAPSVYSPLKSKEKAIRRMHLVLKAMLAEGYIDQDQYDTAIKEELHFTDENGSRPFAGYFLEEIRRYIDTHYGVRALYRDGMKVYSTLNINLQRYAEKALRNGIEMIDKRNGLRTTQNAEELETWYQNCIEQEGRQFEVFKAVISEVGRSRVIVTIKDKDYRVARKDISNLLLRGKPLSSVIKKGDYVLVTKSDNGPELDSSNVVKDKAETVRFYQQPDVQGALLCLEVGSGEVKAMCGGYNFNTSKFNRATQALRQTGSSFKPFVYLAAIDNGFSPSTLLLDEPTNFIDSQTKKVYSPQNHGREYLGPITMTTALAKSVNVVAVQLLDQIGIDTTIGYARRMGITSTLNPYLSLALGASEVSLAEMTTAYSVFANDGVFKEMTIIRSITDRDDRVLEQRFPIVRDVVSADVAYVMTTMLEASVRRGTCWRARILKRAVAAKTGTTDGYIDAWFIGYSPELVAGVWVGYDRKKTLGNEETGSRAAAPVWVDFMGQALKDLPESKFRIPPGVITVHIHPGTGRLYSPQCGDSEMGAFLRGSEPVEYCHRQ